MEDKEEGRKQRAKRRLQTRRRALSALEDPEDLAAREFGSDSDTDFDGFDGNDNEAARERQEF